MLSRSRLTRGLARLRRENQSPTSEKRLHEGEHVEASTGLEHAERLAQEVQLRSAMNLPRHQPEYPPLTLADLPVNTVSLSP